MTVQFIEIDGKKAAILPIADYNRLVAIAEDQLDAAQAEAATARRIAGEEYVPAELVDKIMNGEAPLRVWRNYRGMTIKQLADATGAREATISEIENGKAQGKPVLWRAMADTLDVSVDDIFPEN